ncbi:MAG: 2Fe-2S iron-sulfur cluster binding domain-containing protein [Kiritimatiellaeota bacterium]|nr:2Fe-2S iron-sulfur cluster binding domain-containing protein [Kiritimatiellota bacterium]
MSIVVSSLVLAGLFAALAGVLTFAEKVLINYGVCQIDINRQERVLEVEGGQSLLSALFENEIYIPSACGGKGSCGYCKVRVVSGGGPVLPTETPYLTRRESRSGVRLACQVKVREDLEIVVPEEYLNVKLFQAVVESTRELTYDIKEITLALREPPEIEARPGQYVQIEAPTPDGSEYRAYSISSPSYLVRDKVELNVRLVPGGIGSTYLHGLQKGDAVTFTGPYGEFALSEDPEVEVVCVGGGVGMAPIKNLVYSICARWPERSCFMFFGCRGPRDIFYYDEFRALAADHPNLRVIYALSDPLEPGESWDGETGFIHLAVDRYLKQDGTRRQAFLCGPPPMIEAVTQVLAAKGLAEQDVFYDKF